jgi:hypothetical protein
MFCFDNILPIFKIKIMNKLDKLLKEALDEQRKIDETLKFVKENEEHLTEEQEDKLDEIKYK